MPFEQESDYSAACSHKVYPYSESLLFVQALSVLEVYLGITLGRTL